jgi:piezo-type mechanosensitive ion channel component 1/2
MQDRLEMHKFGEYRKVSEKLIYGCFSFIGLMFVILLPILAFSTINPTS